VWLVHRFYPNAKKERPPGTLELLNVANFEPLNVVLVCKIGGIFGSNAVGFHVLVVKLATCPKFVRFRV
jgi:hypothetical protein